MAASSNHHGRSRTLLGWFASNKKPPNEVQASCADSSQSCSLDNPIPCDNVSSVVPVPVCDLDSSNEPAEIMSPSPKKVRNDDCYLEDSVGLNQSNSSKDMPENNSDAFEYSSPNATLTASTASPVLSPTSITSQVATELVHQSGQTFLDISPVATSSPVQPLGIKFPVTLYSNKPKSSLVSTLSLVRIFH